MDGLGLSKLLEVRIKRNACQDLSDEFVKKSHEDRKAGDIIVAEIHLRTARFFEGKADAYNEWITELEAAAERAAIAVAISAAK